MCTKSFKVASPESIAWSDEKALLKIADIGQYYYMYLRQLFNNLIIDYPTNIYANNVCIFFFYLLLIKVYHHYK